MRTDVILTGLSYAFLLTCITEAAVTLIITRKKRFVLYNFCCNALTNPLLNILGIMLMYKMPHFNMIIYYTAGEFAVLLAETALYAFFDKNGHSKKYYFFLSLVTNAVSLAAGLMFPNI
ncbi:MAG: hypothetical protein IJR45_06615 [Firmicutes bacterium]|nr:hypothetical protein [Bacillota bacterium]MBQ9605068.1 hypothetical protein [Bacillota bacterium]